MMQFYTLSFCILICLQIIEGTFAFLGPSPLLSKRAVHLHATLGAGGKNAAPAIMCEVENVPLLDDVPDG